MPVPPHHTPPAAASPAAVRSRPSWTRRTVLLGLAAVGTSSGCGVRWVAGSETAPSPQRGPDDDAREAALAATRDLLGLLLPAAGGPAPLATVAADAVRACTAHLRALGADPAGTVTATVTAAPTSGGSTSGGSTSGGSASGGSTSGGSTSGIQPVDAQTVVDRLAAAAGTALRAAASTQVQLSGGMARLLASIGADRALLLDDIAAATAVAATPVELPATADPAATPSAGRAQTTALQAALAGEHAAVHAFGLVAGRLAPPRRTQATTELAAHRVARDELSAALVARGATPVQAEAGYDACALTAEAAAALAAGVDDRLAGLYAGLVAAVADDRATAVQALLTAARAARTWGSTTRALPGMTELDEDGEPTPTASSTVTSTATVPTGP